MQIRVGRHFISSLSRLYNVEWRRKADPDQIKPADPQHLEERQLLRLKTRKVSGKQKTISPGFLGTPSKWTLRASSTMSVDIKGMKQFHLKLNTFVLILCFRADQRKLTFWQTETLLSFLKFFDRNKKDQQEAIKDLQSLLDEGPPDGYKALILSLISRCCLDLQTEKAVKYLKEFKTVENQLGDVSQQPEVLASKAFALAF